LQRADVSNERFQALEEAGVVVLLTLNKRLKKYCFRGSLIPL